MLKIALNIFCECKFTDPLLVFTTTYFSTDISINFIYALTDGEKFEGWLEEVCPLLPENSVIVMDNASYHTKMVIMNKLLS